MAGDLFDPDLLDEFDPFEIDTQAAHLFKHPHLGIEDIGDVWASDLLFYPAKPPAHWLMCAEVSGRVLVCRSRHRETAILGTAVRSAATKPRPHSPSDTGETDDQKDV